MRLDHIAFRTTDRMKAAKHLYDTLGYSIEPNLPEGFDIQFEDGTQAKCLVLIPPESLATFGPSIAFGDFGTQWHSPPEIFVSDGSQSSIVAEWVEKNGAGVHHLAYEVDSVVKVMKEWQKKGIKFLSEEPLSCEGLIQVFTEPCPITGIIYELIERETVGFCRENVKDLMISTEEK